MEQRKMAKTVKRMTAARAELLKTYPFFGRLAMNLKLACAPCTTACTDGERLILDPDFAEKLGEQELTFVILHEVLHCVLDHINRSKGLNSRLYNVACDINVNSTIFRMWGVKAFPVAGEIPMHLIPDGVASGGKASNGKASNKRASDKSGSDKREGYLYNAEEIYEMLLQKQKTSPKSKFHRKKDSGAGCDSADSGNGREQEMQELSGQQEGEGCIDRHDVWSGITEGEQMRSVWSRRVLDSAKKMGSAGGAVPPAVREVIQKLESRAKPDWKQLLHDFLQKDEFDYTFVPPDRRFSESDFFFPAFHETEEGSAKNIWVCVDTSGSVSQAMLEEMLAEVRDAMRQAHLGGRLSFFDTSITEPVPIEEEQDLNEAEPVGGGGTSFEVIFWYLKTYLSEDLPAAILIFTDGCAACPQEEAALGVPVLWLIQPEGNTNFSWGKVVEMR